MTLRDDPPIALIDNGWAQNIAFCELDERKCPNKQKYILNTLKKTTIVLRVCTNEEGPKSTSCLVMAKGNYAYWVCAKG